ncbi:MAG: cobalamin-dependent protein [Acidobacteriota bacterium]
MNLTLPYLAAIAPRNWEISLIDEQLEDIDFSAEVDVVAITTWTMNSIRAYEIADRFRERGVPVLLGGPHTSFHCEEAAEHADAVCVGEGEVLWPLMLADAAAGKLKKIYRTDKLSDLQQLQAPRYDLIDLKSYGFFKTFSVQASRGPWYR